MFTSVGARTVLIGLLIGLAACSAESPRATSAAVLVTTSAASLAAPTSTSTVPAGASAASLSAELTIVGGDVVIDVTATGFEIRYVEGDVSGETAHVHSYVDRPPPAAGDNVSLGDPTIVHSTGSTITVRGLEPGEHQIWVIAADGNDDALIPPEPVELTVTIP